MKLSSRRLLFFGLSIVGVSLLVLGAGYSYLYASSPENIRQPAFEHYHIRTQIVVDGQAVDFTKSEFQENYNADSCSVELPEEPVDFHDGVDQMTHVHWKGLTGGEFLKYYGWNFIGGQDNILGRRFDHGMMRMGTVKTHGQLLPEVSEDTNYYVYIGDADSYEQKDWNDFLNQNMEEFFGKKSNLSTNDETGSTISDLFFKKAYAHGGGSTVKEETAESDLDENELTRINNLIGNIVIFAQKDQPSDEQIKDRLNNLVPLQKSTCGG